MFRRWLLILFLWQVFLPGAVDSAEPERVDFSRHIRPILSDRCFLCHGPDESTRKGGLRLDQRASALGAADSGESAIRAGDSLKSTLIHRVTSDDPSLAMPPPDSKKPRLTDDQVRLLKRWIDQGAEYTTHWSFQPPQRPALPPEDERFTAWNRNPIDRFLLAKLKSTGLSPSSETDRTTWLRRLSLDVIGLPPTIAEIDRFQADQDVDAYAKEIERLLKSPHFGERWGRHWLDAARYADSDGFEKDKSRQMWFYRDWVVNAINRDLPYDQFIIQQLAGDLLPAATQDQIVATGFLRNSMNNEEGGVDPEQFRMDAMFDRMDAIGKSMLGLTIQCAQCHSHKYDPMTHEDYYRLFALLNNDHEAQRVVYTPDDLIQIAGLRAQLAEVERQLRQVTSDWAQRLHDWEQEVAAAAKLEPRWTTLELSNAGDNGQRYIDMGDGSILAQGYAPSKVTTELKGTLSRTGITAIRLELLNDANLPCGGPGRSYIGTSALSEITVTASDLKNPESKQTVNFESASADYSNAERDLEANFWDKTNKKRVYGPIRFAIDGNDNTAWGIDAGPGRRNVARNAVFVVKEPFGFEQGTSIKITLKQSHGGWNNNDHMNHNLGRFRLSVTTAANPVADPIPKSVRDVLAIPPNQRSAEQSSELFAYWRTTVPEFRDTNEKAESIWSQWPVGATSLTLQQRETPRMTHLLKRGDFLKPDHTVAAGVPGFLHPLHDESERPNRLSLAKWIVDRQSPTTARVIVNRIWQSYFGTGLVATSEDFGTQSESPSHPELLDWLAVELMEPTVQLPGETRRQPWSLKHLHRMIVTSAAYRQSSHVTSEMLEHDPSNRLLGRASRIRVEGEIVRDIALSASGLLNHKIGGPSVFSPAPAFVFLPPASYGYFDWKEATGDDRYRRGLYTFRRRSTPYPMLMTFDVPNADMSCVRRVRSNTPLQALTTLNEAVFMEAARGLAMLTLKDGGADERSRMQFAFRRCVSRQPDDRELNVMLALLDKQMTRFVDPESKPWEVAANDRERPPELPAGTTASDAAAWTIVSRVLLNLDETITKE